MSNNNEKRENEGVHFDGAQFGDLINIDKEGNAIYHISVGPKIIDFSDEDELGMFTIQRWWKLLRKKHEEYSCCGVFLTLPSDDEVIAYIKYYRQELNLLSGEECVLVIFQDTKFSTTDKFIQFEVTRKSWETAVNKHANEGYSILFANLFGIPFNQFPSLVIFNNIDTPDHVVIDLRDLTLEELREKMRETFDVIRKANKDSIDPIVALNREKSRGNLQNKGRSIVGAMRNFGERTLEMAMEAWFNSVMKP